MVTLRPRFASLGFISNLKLSNVVLFCLTPRTHTAVILSHSHHCILTEVYWQSCTNHLLTHLAFRTGALQHSLRVQIHPAFTQSFSHTLLSLLPVFTESFVYWKEVHFFLSENSEGQADVYFLCSLHIWLLI